MTASRTLKIINKLGMHARAAAQFVQIASNFHSHIEVEKGNHRVNGKSIMGVMMLAAAKGNEITILASGNDAEKSIEALAKLINNRFNEEE